MNFVDKILRPIDNVLNRVTMYRLVVFVLSSYSVLAILLAFMGKLSFSPTALVVSAALTVASAYATDRIFRAWLNIPTNMESSLITALIIFLIVQPAHSISGGMVLVLAGMVSSASKFLLAWNGKHIFNPAAFAAALLSLTGLQATTWWIGSTVFAPFTLLLGLVVVRKIRRFPLFVTFIAVSGIVQLALVLSAHQMELGTIAKHAVLASPLIFLGTIMLTEPATMPPRLGLRLIFGALVALLYVTGWRLGPLIIYPEVALLIGNIFAYVVSPKFRVRLELKEVRKISERVYDYVFQPDRRFTFLPGQYMEWTLAAVPYDARGNRRTFTIASSPTEDDVHLGVKFYEPASMYKAEFEQLQPGDFIYASQLAGNFTLKGNEGKKLVFIAGGIGITPFRSMIKYLIDRNQPADITLLYAVNDAKEFAYITEWKVAANVGVHTILIVTDTSYQSEGIISTQLSARAIKQLVPDYAERMFYISGPNRMVDATKEQLYELAVGPTRIKTDHFSGY